MPVVPCIYCEDFLPKPCGQMDPIERDFYDLHMSCHQHLRFVCKVCLPRSRVNSVFDTLDDVWSHLRKSHRQQDLKITKNVEFPLNVRRAVCQTCNLVINCRDEQGVVRHMLDHRVELKDVPKENTNFILGCRVCKYITKSWEAWDDHFNSRTKYCRKSEFKLIQDLSQKKLFFCFLCANDCMDLNELEAHYRSRQHVSKLNFKPKSKFECDICKADVICGSFMAHLVSKQHREALRAIAIKLELLQESVRNVETSAKFKPQNDQVQLPLAAMSLSSNVDPNFTFVPTSLGQNPFGSSELNPVERCPFCSETVLMMSQLQDHIYVSHEGNLFKCRTCQDTKKVNVEIMLEHFKTSHSDDPDIEIQLPVDLRFYVCKICHGFYKEDSLKVSHVERSVIAFDHNEQVHRSRLGGSSSVVDCSSKCRVCKNLFDDPKEYLAHLCNVELQGKINIKFDKLQEIINRRKSKKSK